ncbi:MAG: Ppx/GppA phosphatase family protein [bacterium]|nr:Ppx/GppA phosphatase family protein [bacterium]
MTRVAVIDCGTNSIRLLVADVEQGADSPDRAMADVVRRMEIARLGEGVDRTGELAEGALARTFGVIEDYADQCRELGVERVRVVATSATRDAANRQVFLEGVRERMGVLPEVLSGDEEARLSFLGAAAGFGQGLAEPILVVDIGGGSTELVLGAAGEVLAEYSMDVGSVRMKERHLASDPPSDEEILAAREDVERSLDAANAVVALSRARTIVGVAGTITSVTAEALGLAAYDSAAIHGSVLPLAAHLHACDWFLTNPLEERRALGHMHPLRADVIGAGALVWSQVLDRVVREARREGVELETVVTSERDILDGAALALA